MKNRAQRPWTMNAKAGGELEILLYEMIGQDWWTGEGTTAKSFADDLKAAGKVSKIHLRVNSPGGNVFDGIAIYNTLLTHGAKITAQVDGIAASIASVILMAASEISMGDNTMLMIHNPWSSITGDSHEMRKVADLMDKVKGQQFAAYQRHTKLSSAEISKMMDAETWMTPAEAIDMGFAEKVVTLEGNDAAMAAHFDLSIFQKVPVQIAARFNGRRSGANPLRITAAATCGCVCAACMKDDCANCDDAGCTDTNCTDCAKQKIAAKVTADLISAEAAKTVALVDARKSLETAETRIANLETELKEAREGWLARGQQLDDLRVENKKTDAAQTKWMERMGGELEESSQLYATALLEADRAAKLAESLQTKFQSRLMSAESELAVVKAERLADLETSAKWSERVRAELANAGKLCAAAAGTIEIQAKEQEQFQSELSAQVQNAGKTVTALQEKAKADATALEGWTKRISGALKTSQELSARAMQEVANHSAAQEDGKAIEAVHQKLLGTLREERTASSSVLAGWTKRISGELKASQELCAKALQEMSRRPEVTEDSKAIEAVHQKLLATLREERAADSAVLAAWTQRLTDDLKKAQELATAAIEEVARRSQVPEDGKGLEALHQKLLGTLSEERTASRTVLAGWTLRVSGDLKTSQEICAEAIQEVSRRMVLSEDKPGKEQFDSALSVVAKTTTDLATRKPLQAESTKAILAELKQSGDSCLNAVQELGRRSSSADIAHSEMVPRVKTAEASLAAIKAESVAESAAASEKLQTVRSSLKQAQKQHGAAVEELARRVRMAAL